MSGQPEDKAASVYVCVKCGVPMEPGRVTISYLCSSFPFELLTCPACGLVLVPEALALGKMLEVEKALEDK